MADTDQTNFTTLTVDLLSAYFANNTVDSDALPGLIRSTHDALKRIDEGTPEAPAEPEFKPAVSVRKSLASRDHIISLIDGKKYKTLKRHLSGHGLTPDQYRERYGLPRDYPMVSPAFSEERRAVAAKIGLGRKPPAPAAAPIEAEMPAAEAAPVTATPPKRRAAAKAAPKTKAKTAAPQVEAASTEPSAAIAAPTSEEAASPASPAAKNAAPKKPATKAKSTTKPAAIKTAPAEVAEAAAPKPKPKATKPKVRAATKPGTKAPTKRAASKPKATAPAADTVEG